ncbi:MAG: ankyrin repeat domain-containing protein [Planctomycetes bacterium]|nr:ankyrin repeat domain-containing protein [Planctomycetota bacterium]
MTTNAAIGAFVDACIVDPAAARGLAAADPGLLRARWAGDPLLHWMVIEDFAGGATTLLDLGVAVDEVDGFGRTPLLYACTLGRLGCVRLLLARGADPNACNDHLGENPLHCAIRRAALDVVLALLGHGARGDYVLPTLETAFGALRDWSPADRQLAVEALARAGVTRDAVFAKLQAGYSSPEEAFGW